MNCPTCHQEIPIGKNKIPLLVCPRCTAAKGYQSILEFQKQFLPEIVKGDCSLTLTKSAEDVKWHIKLSGHSQGWCGWTLHPRWEKKRLPYPKIELSLVCERCREVFEQAAEGLAPEVR